MCLFGKEPWEVFAVKPWRAIGRLGELPVDFSFSSFLSVGVRGKISTGEICRAV